MYIYYVSLQPTPRDHQQPSNWFYSIYFYIPFQRAFYIVRILCVYYKPPPYRTELVKPNNLFLPVLYNSFIFRAEIIIIIIVIVINVETRSLLIIVSLCRGIIL